MRRLFVALALLAVSLAGCAGSRESSGAESQPDYNELKSMVKDILQTEDGKKAIQEAIKTDALKNELLLSQEEMKIAVASAMTSEQGQKQFKEMLEDPQFAAALAKAMQQENERLLKTLMKDPEYQGMMLDVFKNPDFEQQLLGLLKSEPYRKQTMKVVQEALESPLFQEKVFKMVQKVAEQAEKPKKKENGKEKPGDQSPSEEEGGEGGSGGSG